MLETTTYRPDPALPRAVLESRLRTIDKRRAEIEVLLATALPNDDSMYRAQELRPELAGLLDMRRDAEAILHPAKKQARSSELERSYAKQRQRDVALLRANIKHQTEQIEHQAQLDETAGNHRNARLHRLQIPLLPEAVCKEFGIDPALLAEI